MPDGMTRRDRYFCSVGVQSISLMVGLNSIANGVAKFIHHTVGSVLRNWDCFVTL